MYTLFLDTHDKLVTIAFLDGNNLFTNTVESESHSVHFLPLLDKMMNERKIEFTDIKNIVVINGPGSFTGVRIGLTVAKTIAYSMNIPIYAISSLKAYLVSSNMDANKISVIEDSKGFYVGMIDNEIYTDSLNNYKNKTIVKNELDIKKVVDYALKSQPSNVHGIKANYVKVIEALK